MKIEIQLVQEPIAGKVSLPVLDPAGAWLEFRGVVRDQEMGQKISALEYEAYPEMAEREIRRLLEGISSRHPCLAAKVVHRIGVIPAGEAAIYVGIAASHRGEAIALLAEFMDRLKQDVPIWKRRALPAAAANVSLRVSRSVQPTDSPRRLQKPLSLDEALAEIQARCPLLPAVRASLEESFGRVLRETICASGDFPDHDRSTRDGYAILQNDPSETFRLVDTLHAADWRPRELKAGEAVRIATGASLPCHNLRVVMQENVERVGDRIRVLHRESAMNVRRRGEEMRAGESILQPGTRLNAGTLALLASLGCTQLLVGPRLKVCHFTTGDEVIPSDQTPKPGQVRDSNSILIRSLLQSFAGDVVQRHLPEDFEAAKRMISILNPQPSTFDLVLVSGGASVGEKDFTRPLLESLGFEIVFSQVNVRPGRPLIFAQNGGHIAFGLPGNPLSHFVCFHLFVGNALTKLTGGRPPTFHHGTLAAMLEAEPNPRETLWPARCEEKGGKLELIPLPWNSSGDVTGLPSTTALIRVRANRGSFAAGAEVNFWPVNF
ncbi:MAG TPA: molybdenum cofactor biosynthesis protein MoaE [Candidatus Sulfopaludibacter sp.]|nr:molybdenum cofactor biosynthesis protein MoaE [Candidatus Sulfopaludibacter sp.]